MKRKYDNNKIIENILKQKQEYINFEKTKMEKEYRDKKKERRKKLIIYFVLIICILLNFIIKYIKFNNTYKSDKREEKYEVMVIENIKSGDYISYEVKLKNDKGKFKDKFILNIYSNDFNSENMIQKNVPSTEKIYKYGDVLKVNGKIVIPDVLKNEGDFNYKLYLNSKNMVGIISTYKVENINKVNGNLFLKYCFMLKEFLNNKIETKLPAKEANLLKSMIYGDKRFLDKEIIENFTNIGISHILSVSGANVAAVVCIFKIFLNKLKLKKKYINVILVCIILIFTAISAFELSILRACIMWILLLCLENIKVINRILLSLCIILSINSYSIFNVGMQLSYIATLSITLFYPKIYNKLELYSKLKKDKLNKEKYIVKKEIISLLSVTLSVQVLLLPIQLYYFNSFNIIMIISNVLIVSIAGVVTNIGIVMIMLSSITLVFNLIINIEYLCITAIINITNFLNYFNFLNITVKSPCFFSIILYYILIVLICYKQVIQKNIFKIKNIKIKEILLKILKKLCINKYKIIYCYITLQIVYYTFFNNYIYFFNVGQGDMALLHYKNRNIIFDCGSTKNSIADREMLSFLKYNNIKKIDIMSISHMHKDHISGIKNIVATKAIGAFVYSESKEKSKDLDILKVLTIKNNIKNISVVKGDVIEIKNKIKIEILSPTRGIIKDSDIANANSMVSKITVGKKIIYIMGDATENTENLLVKEFEKTNKIENIDVLKVGHHGSKTSTSSKFLNRLKISTAVISSKKSVYGHPDESIIKKLKSKNIDIKITEKIGGIKIKL